MEHPSRPLFNTTKDGRRYPQDGELIGPAWEAAWNLMLVDRGWVSSNDLVDFVTSEVEVMDKTVWGLLACARSRDLIEVRYRMTGSPKRRAAEYRVPP